MKLSTKLALAMGGLVLILCLSGGVSLVQMDRINAAATDIADNWMPSATCLEELNTLLADYRLAEFRFIYARSDAERDEWERRTDAHRKRRDELRAAYARYPADAQDKALFRTVEEGWKKYDDLHETFLRLLRAGKKDEAVEALFGDSLRAYRALSVDLRKLVDLRQAGAQKADKEADVLFSGARLFTLILLGVSLLVAAGIALWIIRDTLRRLGKDPGDLGAIARRVAGGDYDIDDGSPKIGVYGNIVDMVAALEEHIDNTRRESERAAEESEKAREAMTRAEAAGREAGAKTESLLHAADTLEDVAHIVSSASAELSAQIGQSERGAAEQAARVSETAAAMEEMNATVLEVAKNAGTASDVSAGTRRKAEEGAAVVKEAVASIEGVQRRSLALKEDMAALGEHARNITRIMGVISDIADQTNLLALNAAIEAARAGDAGRGFAVVADEVRKLAEKTMASTSDVSAAIEAIQRSADQNIRQVEDAVRNIEEATGLAGRSGTALEEIVSMVDDTADQVRTIAASSEQQSASSEEINRSIAQVNTIAGETSRAMEEAAGAVTDLAAQAQALSGLIKDMKRG